MTFKPTATGEVSNTVTLTDSAGGLHTVMIQGNGVNQGVISATGMTVTQLPGTTSTPQAITVNNTGSGPMTITSLTFTEGNGSNFALVSAGTTCPIGTVLPPGGSCIVNVTFTAPSATGSTSANLRVNANLGNGVSGSTSASVTGTVVSGGFTVAPTPPLNFGTVALGTTIDYSQVFNGYGSISITNNNPGPVTITKVATSIRNRFCGQQQLLSDHSCRQQRLLFQRHLHALDERCGNQQHSSNLHWREFRQQPVQYCNQRDRKQCGRRYAESINCFCDDRQWLQSHDYDREWFHFDGHYNRYDRNHTCELSVFVFV